MSRWTRRPSSVDLRAHPPVALEGRGAPRAAVIIPHLNTPEMLVRCLQSIAAQRLDQGWVEVVVVDNGSRMPLAAIATAWPDVRFLVQHQVGPGPARNLGAQSTRAPILCFIDADCRALPGWLMTGIAAVEAAPAYPVGGEVEIDTGGKRRLTGVEAFECAFAFRQRKYILHEKYSVTACLTVSRDVFDRIGPFCGIERAEDADWGGRGAALGHPTRYLPAMGVLHPPRRSFQEMHRKWLRLASQSLAAHEAAGKPLWQYRMKAVVVALSAPAHTPRMLLSPKVNGLGNRLRGLGFLYRIRWTRTLDMLMLAREAAAGAAPVTSNWNR